MSPALKVLCISLWALIIGTKSGSLWLWPCSSDESPWTLLKTFQFSIEPLVLSVPEEPGCTWLMSGEFAFFTYLVWWQFLLLKPEDHPVFPFPAFLAPRNQCPLEAPGETKAHCGPGLQMVVRLNVSVPFKKCTLSSASCCLVSILLLPLHVFFSFCLIFFPFIF